MLKITFLELCLRGLPEMFLLIWGINYINMKKTNIKMYLTLSLFLALIVYFIRMLPIQYGVHTFITVLLLITMSYYVNKLSLIKSIKSCLIVVILLLVCECFNVFILSNILNDDVQVLFNNPLLKVILGVPSLIFYIFFVYMFKTFLNRNLERKFK